MLHTRCRCYAKSISIRNLESDAPFHKRHKVLKSALPLSTYKRVEDSRHRPALFRLVLGGLAGLTILEFAEIDWNDLDTGLYYLSSSTEKPNLNEPYANGRTMAISVSQGDSKIFQIAYDTAHPAEIKIRNTGGGKPSFRPWKTITAV